MFQAAKDALASKGAQSYLNGLIRRYGEIERMKIDSRARTMEATCHLQGETTPVTVRVGRYTIHETAGKKYLEVADCTCSRVWIQNLLCDMTKGRRVELPGWAASAL